MISAQQVQATAAGHGPARLSAVAGLALAVLLLAMAWPRLQASVAFLPVDTALARFHDSQVLPSPQLLPLAARAHRAIAHSDHHRYWDGLAELHYLRALDPQTPNWERRPAMRESRAASLEAVRRNPARPATWLRIAVLDEALGEPPEALAPALEMSMLAGRFEPGLLMTRAQLGARHAARLDRTLRAMVADQVALAWRHNPQAFQRAVTDGRLDIENLRLLLRPGHADILAELEASLDGAA